MPRASAQHVLDYLARHAVLTLATCGPNGAAAAAVFYAARGLDLFFLSAPGTLHCRNIAADPRVAVTIQDSGEDWARIQGLQLHATTHELHGAAAQAAQQTYMERFPAVFSAAAAAPATGLAAALKKIAWFQLTVTRIRYIDNTAGFAHADEWSRDDFIAGLKTAEGSG
jgi:uncharacterized protein YhbP (UPF0306 family)